MVELLSRETFRENVFRRDNYRCVVPKCSETVEKGYVGTKFSAHHVIERRLWTNPLEKEGYIKSNGTSLCETHHQFGAETCVLQPQVLRKWTDRTQRLAEISLLLVMVPTRNILVSID